MIEEIQQNLTQNKTQQNIIENYNFTERISIIWDFDWQNQNVRRKLKYGINFGHFYVIFP